MQGNSELRFFRLQVVNQAANWWKYLRGAVCRLQYGYASRTREPCIVIDQLRHFSDVLCDKLSDRLSPASATTSNQSAVVVTSTSVTAIEYADQYVATNAVVSGEKHAETDYLDCLEVDQLGDEDTSYWWDNGYTELTSIVDTRNICNADVQLPAKATEFVLTNCSKRQSRRTTSPAHDDVAVITTARWNSKQSPWTSRRSS